MKKLGRFVLLTLLALLCISSGAFAAETFEVDGLRYTTIAPDPEDSLNKTVRLDGFQYGKSIEDLIIPATVEYQDNAYTVTAINDKAFMSKTAITSLTFDMDSKLKTIGEAAFSGCNNLSGSLTIPASVETIEEAAFSDSKNISGLNITDTEDNPSKLQTIGDYAFHNNAIVGPLIIPASVKTIGEHAFQGNAYITSVEFKGTLKRFELYAFGDCLALSSLIFNGDAPGYVNSKAFINAHTTGTVYYPAGKNAADYEILRDGTLLSKWNRRSNPDTIIPSAVNLDGLKVGSPVDKNAAFTFTLAESDTSGALFYDNITAENLQFTNLPDGLIAGDPVVSEDKTTVAVPISGTPTKTGTFPVALPKELPKERLEGALQKAIVQQAPVLALTVKITGAAVSKLTLNKKVATNIIIHKVNLEEDTKQVVEYACLIDDGNNPQPVKDDWSEKTDTEGKITFSDLEANTAYLIFARSKESDTHYAGEPQSTKITTDKGTGAAVSTPTANASNIKGDTITLNASRLTPDTGQTILYGIGTETTPPEKWQNELEFKNLTPVTEYYVYAKAEENAKYYEGSVSAAAKITTGKGTGEKISAPVALTVTASSITVEAIADATNGQSAEYSIDGTNWQTSPTFDGLTAKTEYTFSTRYAENDKYNAGEFQSTKITTEDVVEPNITEHPAGGTTPLNAPAALSVTAALPDGADGTLSHQWYQNGIAIEGATEATYTPDTGSEGETSYHVAVTNTVGNASKTVNSETAVVTVYRITHNIIKGDGQTVEIPTTEPISIEVEGDNLDAVTGLSLDGRTLKKTGDNTYEMVTLSSGSIIFTLSAEGLSAMDKGTHKLEASFNDYGVESSTVMTFTVKDKGVNPEPTPTPSPTTKPDKPNSGKTAKTGDAADLGTTAALLLISACGIAALCVKKRRGE